ncbi:MAG: dihydropteroate synthase [Chitinophagales bacterium]|nr:dihydropteroate synthase [Chitinophagales bacterium]
MARSYCCDVRFKSKLLNFAQNYIFNLESKVLNTFSLNCKGRLKVFEGAALMGILNLTPDSFFDGGNYNNLDLAFEHAVKMLSEGVDIIDVGGASSRPNAAKLGAQEEIDRVAPIIEKLNANFPELIISIDSYQAAVAEEAIRKGASIINDVSGGDLDEHMFALVAKLNCPYVLTHMKGDPSTMQLQPEYDDVLLEIAKDFSAKLLRLDALGVKDILLDPGFGFGKSLDHNYELLANLSYFKHLFHRPILVGLSRKSMLYKALDITPKESLNASTAAHIMALERGAQILRVHDVKAAKEALTIFQLTHRFSKRNLE